MLDNSLDTGDFATLQDAWDETMTSLNQTNHEQIYTAASPENIETGNSTLYYKSMLNHIFVNTNGPSSGQNYSCHLWNTTYLINIKFENGIQAVDIEKLTYTAPLNIASEKLWYTYSPAEVPYWAMFKALTNILVTEIYFGSTGTLWGGDSFLMQSGIVACPEIRSGLSAELFSDWMCRANSVPGAIEDLSHNLTLSVLSSALLANETAADVVVRSAANIYTYNWRDLLLAYAVAIAATVLCVATGFHALMKNGYSAGASFSSILMTTRNADLDQLARGHCLGESPLADDIKKTVLRYGVLKGQQSWDGSTEPHAAFGLRDDVLPMKRGDPCW